MAGKKLSGLGKGIDSMGIDALIPTKSRRVVAAANKNVDSNKETENVSLVEYKKQGIFKETMVWSSWQDRWKSYFSQGNHIS